MDSDWRELCRLAFDMTGGNTDDPTDAFTQWQEERDAMREMSNENEAMKILQRRFILALQLAEKAINAVEADASMFIKDTTRRTIAQFQEQYAKTQTTITITQEINNGKDA